MRPAPARLPILRRPPARVVGALLLAVVTALAVHRVTSTAEATVERWGTTAVVWVATDELPVGQVVSPGDVTRQRRPAGHVPGGATGSDPAGRLVREHVAAGEVLTDRRLGDGDALGVAALVPDGWRALAVPLHDATLPVEPGHRVDVVAAGDPGAGGGPAGAVVAAGALVVHVAEDGTVTVAVPSDRVTRVAAALVGTAVTLALAP